MARPVVAGRADGKLEIVLITGFPAGLLQCNCYVLAPHPGADAIIVDPGQRAMGQLRRILDENRLTPAAVLLTHGHIDHIWSAQKVADTYGCPTYIHPEDRFMLTDPIKDFGPKLGQLLLAAIFREPKQVIELDRDGDKIDLAGISVTVDHTPGHTRGSVVFRVSRRQRTRVHRRYAVRAHGGPHRPVRRQWTGPVALDRRQAAGSRRQDGGTARTWQLHHHRRRTPAQPISRRVEPVTVTQFSAPKGVPDYVPPDSVRFVAVRSALLDAARRAGYSDIELPIFEDTALFARGVGSPPTWCRRRCTPLPIAGTAR